MWLPPQSVPSILKMWRYVSVMKMANSSLITVSCFDCRGIASISHPVREDGTVGLVLLLRFSCACSKLFAYELNTSTKYPIFQPDAHILISIMCGQELHWTNTQRPEENVCLYKVGYLTFVTCQTLYVKHTVTFVESRSSQVRITRILAHGINLPARRLFRHGFKVGIKYGALY